MPLPTRCSTEPCSHGAVKSRQYSPARTRARASAPMARIDSRESSAPTRTSTTKTATSTARIASVTGGTRPMRRSRSTRRESSISDVMRSGTSGKGLTSATLTRVEHDAEGDGDAPVERARRVGREIEHIAIEQRELAVELAEDFRVVAADEDEVRAEQAEERPDDAPEQRQHDRVLDRHGERCPAGRGDVPALAHDVVDVGLLQRRERLAARRHDRVRPGQECQALVLDHAEQDFAP